LFLHHSTLYSSTRSFFSEIFGTLLTKQQSTRINFSLVTPMFGPAQESEPILRSRIVPLHEDKHVLHCKMFALVILTLGTKFTPTMNIAGRYYQSDKIWGG
jgi:hypothetical protein